VHDEVLDGEKRRVIALQEAVVRQERFFLAGGTGLGLRLGHRLSRDIDWFSPLAFDASDLAKALGSLGEKPTEVKVQGNHTLRAYYGNLETSFLRYTQVVARPEVVIIAGLNIPVADVETLALMKAAAVHDRGTKRDFVDIHAICRMPGWSVERFIALATTRLPLQPVQMKLAMTYFVDAERDAMPRGYTTPWATVKIELQHGIQEWERRRNRGLER
jgi:Nucleotidyl transferase AbiEii toxin, Type IV TA system